ncbi:MAG: DUF937 domain-containing protein [Acidimicrobiia bacterium]|jgi:hypothetical protein
MEDINEDLRETIPFDRLAARLGASREEVEQATELALPALLQGMNANAHRSQDEAASLLGALIKDHDGSVLDADDVVDRVNPDEGRKIVGHVFGDRTEPVVARLGAKTGGTSLMENLLPMLAPMVMAWLSKQLGGAVSSRGGGSSSSGGLGDILGGMLGGGGSEGGGLDDLLGGLLGGGSPSGAGASGGGLGDILGGMLGGGAPHAGASSGGGLLDILGGLAGQAGQSSGAKQQMPDLSDLFGPR